MTTAHEPEDLSVLRDTYNPPDACRPEHTEGFGIIHKHLPWAHGGLEEQAGGTTEPTGQRLSPEASLAKQDLH